jgi:hypothetical protein
MLRSVQLPKPQQKQEFFTGTVVPRRPSPMGGLSMIEWMRDGLTQMVTEDYSRHIFGARGTHHARDWRDEIFLHYGFFFFKDFITCRGITIGNPRSIIFGQIAETFFL